MTVNSSRGIRDWTSRRLVSRWCLRSAVGECEEWNEADELRDITLASMRTVQRGYLGFKVREARGWTNLKPDAGGTEAK